MRVPFGAIWGHLRPFEAIWGHLRSFEVICGRGHPFGALWSQMTVPFETIWGRSAIWGHLWSRPRPFEPLAAAAFWSLWSLWRHFEPFLVIRSYLMATHGTIRRFHLKITQNLIQRSFGILRIIILEFSGLLSRCDLELSEVEKWAGIWPSPLTPQLSPSHPNPPGYYAFVKR